ncbi:MAG: ABC transporter permease [Deltaproteobacteria bacterium]|jgi:phospholipid/cholesterol/gamma-HCH transport system permease protein|nr:ABC transporter permease [Deltaproteobacteria bacterium]
MRHFQDSVPAGRRREPGAEVLDGAEGAVLHLWGEWSVYTLPECKAGLDSLLSARERDGLPPFRRLNLGRITRIDTAGALLLNNLVAALPGERDWIFENSGAEARAILDISLAKTRVPPPPPPPFFLLSLLNETGAHVLGELRLFLALLGFFGEFGLRLLRSLCRPRDIHLTACVYHMEHAGLRAAPIVCLLNFMIGLVIAYMALSSLAMFGAQIYVVNLLEVVTLREMGVLITAILVAGRSGSSFTAQIGVMVSNQEVDAMRVMGLDPVLVLALPRVLALVVVLPCLVVLADIMGLLGGLVAAWVSMDISPAVFIDSLRMAMRAKHVLVGVAKAPVFALVIGCVGCFLGFQVKGGAAAVGILTTRSVVESIFLVILLDALFALLFNMVRI